MEFLKQFTPNLIVESPGRINLIGEHTDYNLGFALPTAIEKKIIFRFQKNKAENQCNVYSAGFNAGLSFNLQAICKSDTEWENYILGVICEISKRTTGLKGFDCTIESFMPQGSGVSSSAALECGLAFGLNELFNLGLTKRDIVELARDAEHTFVGTQCGIMDQFASVMSKEGHVILLDCNSLEHTYIPIHIEPYKIVLLNSNVSHNLASSEYNTRRTECEIGVSIIKKKYPQVSSLRDVTRTILASCKHLMGRDIFNRCTYVVGENERVLNAVEAFKANDLNLLGTLLYKTHHGLRKLYEVSCPEIDFLVDFSKPYDAVLGARIMGGGFGGCTINIVHADKVESYVEEASEAYYNTFHIHLTAFEALPSGGTSLTYT